MPTTSEATRKAIVTWLAVAPKRARRAMSGFHVRLKHDLRNVSDVAAKNLPFRETLDRGGARPDD
jgi:hypothetical protein